MTTNNRVGRPIPPIPLFERPGMVNGDEPTNEEEIAERARRIAAGLQDEVDCDLDRLLPG